MQRARCSIEANWPALGIRQIGNVYGTVGLRLPLAARLTGHVICGFTCLWEILHGDVSFIFWV